jgi:hypothetical protein
MSHIDRAGSLTSVRRDPSRYVIEFQTVIMKLLNRDWMAEMRSLELYCDFFLYYSFYCLINVED